MLVWRRSSFQHNAKTNAQRQQEEGEGRGMRDTVVDLSNAEFVVDSGNLKLK